MLAKVLSYGLSGLDAFPVTIEVDITRGLPSTTIVGLPDNAVKESKERVRSAIKNSGYKFAPQRITINLSPADIKKEGPSFDLAIALGILAASGQIDGTLLHRQIILGELSLDGQIRPVNGGLSIAMAISPHDYERLILPAANAPEAALSDDIPVYPVKTLAEVIHFLNTPESLTPFRNNVPALFNKRNVYHEDFCDVKGHASVKRGLEVTAAGGHNCLMLGPPGSGKTMLAKRLPTIMPDMTLEESLETTKIHSVVGLVPPQTGLVATRPFRSPHHTSSDVALVGGGSIPKPGEVSLSHNGILFLDELPEFNRNVLESLRQPMEDHYVTISRASRAVRFPSRFMLVASMNPCPCGYLTDPKKACHCTAHQIQRYLSKISGPLLDRIDMHLEVPPLKPLEILTPPDEEPSRIIKKRTVRARTLQQKRFASEIPKSRTESTRPPRVFTNAQMTPKQIRKYCPLTKESRELLRDAMEELGFSARAHDKILKVARTVSDLAGCEDIRPDHIAEAIQYRSLDRNWQ